MLPLAAGTVYALGLPLAALAADETPDALIRRLSEDVLNTVRAWTRPSRRVISTR